MNNYNQHVKYIFKDNEMIECFSSDSNISYLWEHENVRIYHTKDKLIHHKSECAIDWNDCPFFRNDDNSMYNKSLLRSFWVQKGLIHRDNGPAIIAYDQNNRVREWSYFKNGLIHNAYGPAAIVPNINFEKHEYEWVYKSKFIIPVKEKLHTGMALNIPMLGITSVLKQLEGYVYEVLYGNKKFPIIGSQNTKGFDMLSYMKCDFNRIINE